MIYVFLCIFSLKNSQAMAAADETSSQNYDPKQQIIENLLNVSNCKMINKNIENAKNHVIFFNRKEML